MRVKAGNSAGESGWSNVLEFDNSQASASGGVTFTVRRSAATRTVVFPDPLFNSVYIQYEWNVSLTGFLSPITSADAGGFAKITGGGLNLLDERTYYSSGQLRAESAQNLPATPNLRQISWRIHTSGKLRLRLYGFKTDTTSVPALDQSYNFPASTEFQITFNPPS